jgi:putative transposase
MPRFRRLVVTDYPHHVTQRGVRRQTTFFDDHDYQTYLSIAAELKEKLAIEVWAYCLMPNHIHSVVVPRENGALSKYFATLHRRYARVTNAKYKWRGHLWQERFYSVVMDESHTFSAMRYVELNPVRAGIASLAHEWPWSSARGHLKLARDPIIEGRAAESLVPNWRDYLSETVGDKELEWLRDRTRIGRPDGTRDFVDTIEALSGRVVRKRGRAKLKK